MASSSSSASTGFTLHYTGAKFGPNGVTLPRTGENKTQTQTEKVGEIFGNQGSMVIRYGTTLQQFTDTIEQPAYKKYQSNPVQDEAKGADEADLFEPGINESLTCRATAKLQNAAHKTIGKTKVMNERAQPLVHVNRGTHRGQLDLWGRMHAAVWHTGINLGPTLTSQDFLYVCCPENISEKEYNDIDAAMAGGEFKVKGNEVVVFGKKGLKTCPPKQFYNDKEMVEVKANGTFQKHGLVINGGPLGWMIHKDSPKIVPQDMVEDLVRTMKIAQGGFYEMTKEQRDLVTAGRLKNTNGLGLFEQNQTFNAMFEICGHLEKEYGFNPEKLFGNSLVTASNRVTDFFTKHENVEDFLTGPILTEMIQSLRVTRPNSTREAPPLRFTNPFVVTLNNAHVIAYAYDASYKGMPLIKVESLVKDDRLKDVKINGELALPSLSYGKNAGAILSTAILVSEQMLLEQIFREAYVNGGNAGIADVLKQVLGENEKIPELVSKIAVLIGRAEKDSQGRPILGLQFEHCDELVAAIREAFGTNHLINLVQKLDQNGILTDEVLVPFYQEHGKNQVHEALNRLMRLGEIIQKNPATSAAIEGSKGINAGLVPLVRKMFLDLNDKTEQFQVQGVTREQLDHEKAAQEAAKSSASSASSASPAAPSTTATPAPVVSSTSGTATENNRAGASSQGLRSLVFRAIEVLATNAPLIASVAFMSMIPRADAPSF